MKKYLFNAYLVLLSTMLIASGVIVWVVTGKIHPIGSFIVLLGIALSLLAGSILVIKEIKAMRSGNYKRLSVFFTVSLIVSFAIILGGFSFMLYVGFNSSSYYGWDALGYYIGGMFIAAFGVLINTCLSVSLAIRKIVKSKQSVHHQY